MPNKEPILVKQSTMTFDKNSRLVNFQNEEPNTPLEAVHRWDSGSPSNTLHLDNTDLEINNSALGSAEGKNKASKVRHSMNNVKNRNKFKSMKPNLGK